jgi:hypothetical protein
MDLTPELGEHMGACGSEADATREHGSAASMASSCATSMEQGQIQGLLHPAVATHAWRPRHGGGNNLLILTRFVERHRLLDDGTGHGSTDSDVDSFTMAPTRYELCFFLENQFFISVHLRN